jgi:hypothetical protein
VCKYFIDVLSEKRKFEDGLIIKKVRVTRRVLERGPNLFMKKDLTTEKGVTKDDATFSTEESKFFDSHEALKGKSEEH